MSEQPHAHTLRGLYLLTPDEADTTRLLHRVAPLLAHARLLQYRNKQADVRLRQQQAVALQALCAEAGVPLIVNDDAQLAMDVGAAGVHLGQGDGAIAEARALLGDDALIGATCHGDPALARIAAESGADYLAFGAFFPSASKPQARTAALRILADVAHLGLPRVAIGGVTTDNAPALVAAGADMLAVIGGVFDAPDPLAAARRLAALHSAPVQD